MQSGLQSQGQLQSLQQSRKIAITKQVPATAIKSARSLILFHAVREGAFGERVHSQRTIPLACRRADSPHTEVPAGTYTVNSALLFSLFITHPFVLLSFFYTTRTPPPRRVRPDNGPPMKCYCTTQGSSANRPSSLLDPKQAQGTDMYSAIEQRAPSTVLV